MPVYHNNALHKPRAIIIPLIYIYIYIKLVQVLYSICYDTF